MTIILFLIDTSASMNARTYLGARPTLLDVSKDAVEKFLKVSRPFARASQSSEKFFGRFLGAAERCWRLSNDVELMTLVIRIGLIVDSRARSLSDQLQLAVILLISKLLSLSLFAQIQLRQRDIASRGDRYMLLTFEENPANIKVCINLNAFLCLPSSPNFGVRSFSLKIDRHQVHTDHELVSRWTLVHADDASSVELPIRSCHCSESCFWRKLENFFTPSQLASPVELTLPFEELSDEVTNLTLPRVSRLQSTRRLRISRIDFHASRPVGRSITMCS